MTKLQKWIIGITGVILLGLITWIFWYVSQTELSTQLGTLFNVLLTVFSILISLIISQYYFESSREQTIQGIKDDYRKNNKLYSQKAAEKVDNLSNELSKLSIYLQSIDDNDDLDPATTLLVREEKIRSAIHIVETLKSINDKSLSDWLGVLDEEDIEQQTELREEQREERESDFKSILDNYKFLTSENSKINIHYNPSSGSEQLDTVHTDINELTKRIDKLATSIIGTPIKTRKAPLKKQEIDLPCPVCKTIIEYKQRPSANSVKGMRCSNCSSKLIARWSSYEGFTLSIKPTGYVGPGEAREVPEDIVNQVKEALPAQPWAKGIGQQVAKELGISNNDFNRAVDVLIKKGIFKLQVDGVLYNPINDMKTSSPQKEKLAEEAVTS